MSLLSCPLSFAYVTSYKAGIMGKLIMDSRPTSAHLMIPDFGRTFPPGFDIIIPRRLPLVGLNTCILVQWAFVIDL